MKLKSEFVRNVITLTTGTTIAQVTTIAVSPILTRLYSTGDFGLFALFISTALTISVIASGRYELAILLPEKDEDAINIVALSLIIAFFVSGATFVIFWIFNTEISNLLNNPGIAPWLYFVPLAVFFTGSYQCLNYWFNRKKQFTLMAVSRAAQSAITAGTKFSMGLGGVGVFGLVGGALFGNGCAAGLLGWKLYNGDTERIHGINRDTMKNQAVRYKRFPIYSSWSGLLNTASLQVPVFLLSAFFTSTVVGYYYISHRVLSIPLSMIGMSIGQVFFQKASEYKKNPEKLKEITFTVYKKLLYIGVFPLLLIMVYGDYIFSFVFGSNWQPAGEYARFLSLWLLFVFIASPLSTLTSVLEKQKAALIFNVLLFISRVVVLVVGGLLLQDAYMTVVLFGLTGMVFIFGFILYLLKLVGIPYFHTVGFTAAIVLGAGWILVLSRYLIGLV